MPSLDSCKRSQKWRCFEFQQLFVLLPSEEAVVQSNAQQYGRMHASMSAVHSIDMIFIKDGRRKKEHL